MGKDDLKVGSISFSDPFAVRTMTGLPVYSLPPPGIAEPTMFAIDLSALSAPARPAVAAALQAAVVRLAAGEAGPIDLRRAADDAILAELVKGQMRQIVAGAAKADASKKCPTCEGEGDLTEDVGQAGDQTITETYACPDCDGRGIFDPHDDGDDSRCE